jgi:tetratricopeptide (TPR) repeat protein
MAGYARRLAADGLAQFSSRYRFTTTEPVVVEIYPNHDDFVVRTTGMPGLGILGVAFGYVVALDSPSAHPAPDYHWGTTLWHELAHVYTLEMTNHRVPRWFSEGISVYEEWRSGPVAGMRIPAVVFAAIKQEKLLPVARLDRGFIRPDYPEQVQVSYTQAGLVCEFIHREYGFGAILALLGEFARGADTRLALESALDIPVAAFDERFLAFLNTEFGDVVDGLDVWAAARAASLDSLARRDWEAALQSAARAIAIHPGDVEIGSPYLTLASAYAETAAPDKEVEILERYWRQGGYEPAALRRLAERLHAAGRTADANSVLGSLIYVTPFDQELHGRLGDWLLEAGRAADALTEYEILLSMEPHDRADAHYRIARAHAALDDADATRRHLLLALDIAPHYRPAQKLLLELNRK